MKSTAEQAVDENEKMKIEETNMLTEQENMFLEQLEKIVQESRTKY